MMVFFQTFGVFIIWQPRSFFLLQKSDPTNTEVISFRIIDFGKKVLSKFSSYFPFIFVSFTRTHTRTPNLTSHTHAHTPHTHFSLNTSGESAHFLLDYVLPSFVSSYQQPTRAPHTHTPISAHLLALADRYTRAILSFVVLACHELILDGFDQLLSFALSTL